MSRRPNPTNRVPTAKRPLPKPPAGLGADGLAAWTWVWSPDHVWITVRHLGLAERYCRLRDVLAQLFAQLNADGVSVAGSRNQERVSSLLPQVKNLSTELRLCEIELGLTPASESKTAPTPAPTATPAPRANTDTKPADTSIVTLLSDHRSRKASPRPPA